MANIKATGDSEAARLIKHSPARKVKKQRIKKNQSRKKPSSDTLQPPSQSLLMSLPPELRNMVYEYVLAPDMDFPDVVSEDTWRLKPEWTTALHKRHSDDFCGKRVKQRRSKQPGLLRVSRQVRSEVIPMYYDLNQFRVFVNIDQLSGARRWLNLIAQYDRNLRPGQGMYTKLQLVMSTTKSKWHKINQLLPLALIAMDHPDLKFRGYYWWEFNEEVVGLGQEGARKGWSEDWLAVRFDEWLQDQRGRPGMRVVLYEKNKRIKAAALKKGIAEPILVRDPTARLMGDTYATRSRGEIDRVFKADIRHLPSSDRKLRSMAKQ